MRMQPEKQRKANQRRDEDTSRETEPLQEEDQLREKEPLRKAEPLRAAEPSRAGEPPGRPNRWREKDQWWEAVIACRAEYDGLFYYGVKTTRIFCRPSCRSKTPKREHVDFFGSAQEAMAKGYRPCKRCRPDLQETVYDPNEQKVEEIRALLEQDYHTNWTLGMLARSVGMSPFHLQRIYKKYTGESPKQHLNRIRVEEAKRLLAKGGQTITEICFAVGFPGLTAFYRAFREMTGTSPREYRNQCLRSGQTLSIHRTTPAE